jgi:hypothetical protein
MGVAGEFELIDDFIEAALSLLRHHHLICEDGRRSVLQRMGVGQDGFGGD